MDEQNLEQALPPGAVPKDVADDVDIKASEGEFIFPAHIVRYLGVSKLEGMVKKASAELEKMHQDSRIGGKVEQPPAQEEVVSEEVPAFAEGGLVTQTATPEPVSAIEWEYQTTPSGFKIRVPKISGRYVSSNFNVKQDMGGEGRNAHEQERVGLEKDVKDWSVDDFSTYSKSVGTPQGRMGAKVANTLVGAVTGPVKGLIDKAVAKKDLSAKEALDKMATTGVDQAGNPLSQEDLTRVKEAKGLVDRPKEDGIAEKVAGTVAGSVMGGSVVKTAAKAADAATGGHVKGAIDKFKDTVKETIRGGIDTTYGQKKEEEKKGLVDKPSDRDKSTPSGGFGSSDRHNDGTPNVTGNIGQDREIEDSINR